MNARIKNIITEIISSLLIMLFVYAGLSKLFSHDNFKFQLYRSPYVTHFAGLLAWGLPITELLASGLLVIKKTRLAGLYASFFLMVLFTGYIYAMLQHSPFLPCSCGGVLSMMSWQEHFYFNVFFLLLALGAILISGKDRSAAVNAVTS